MEKSYSTAKANREESAASRLAWRRGALGLVLGSLAPPFQPPADPESTST